MSLIIWCLHPRTGFAFCCWPMVAVIWFDKNPIDELFLASVLRPLGTDFFFFFLGPTVWNSTLSLFMATARVSPPI